MAVLIVICVAFAGTDVKTNEEVAIKLVSVHPPAPLTAIKWILHLEDFLLHDGSVANIVSK